MKQRVVLSCAVVLIAALAVLWGCADKPGDSADGLVEGVVVGGYDIVLVGGAPTSNGDGTWTWIWRITNTNPGNGQNGTFKDLSHWSFLPGTCLVGADIVSAWYGYNGTTFTEILPTPTLAVDPSQNCYTGEVFKFNYGTSGANPTYYKLVVNRNFAVDNIATAIWKAGTACGQGSFQGIGCEQPNQCYASETAWGAGTRFVTRGSWATYFSLAAGENTVTKTLWAGQTMNVGTITATRDVSGNYTTTFTATGTWVFSELHFAYGASVVPGNNPAPGQFPLKAGFDYPYVTTYTFNFTGPVTGSVHLAAHAVVLKPVPCP